MRYGYARVSTSGQDLEVQIRTLESEGCDVIYSEKFTGTKRDRPKLDELISKLSSGDTLIVTKLDRLARNTIEGMEIVKELFDKGVRVHVLNVGLLENTTMGKFFLTTLLAVAEMERNMIVERTQEGKMLARQSPDFKEGRPRTSKAKLNHAIDLLEQHTYKQVVEMTGISKSTLIREVKRRKESSSIT